MDLPSAEHPDKFYKVDPNTGTVLKTIPSPENNYIGGMDYVDGYLWYSQYYASQPSGRDVLIKMDTTGVTVDTIVTVGEQPMGVAFNGQFLWCAEDTGFGNTRQEIYEYDPVTGAYTGNFVRNPDNNPRDMAFDGQYFWLVGYHTTNSIIYQFDVSGGTPSIQVPVTSVNFGLTLIGQTSTAQLNVFNTGNAPLSIDSLHFSNNVFSSSTTFPVTIPPNDAAILELEFTPPAADLYSGTMTIYCNDPLSPTVDVSLTGKGMYPDPTISVTETSHDFGDVWVAQNGLKSWRLGLINQGLQNLEISDLETTLPVFYTTSPPLPFSINPDDTVDILVWFEPQDPISYQGNLLIHSNDPQTPILPVLLQGTGVGGPYNQGYQFWNYDVPLNPYRSSLQDKKVEGLKQMGDINGDGVNDVVISTINYMTIALNGASSGVADTFWVFNTGVDDNNTGSISLNGMFSAQKAIQIASDLNGDCKNDVVIGTNGGNEHVYAIDGVTGEEIWSFGDDINYDLGGFGAVDVKRDFTGDLIPDVVAVSSSNSQFAGHKSVYLFDGTDGTMLWQHYINVPGPASGYSVVSIGDVTGDHIPDVVAGYGGDGSTQFARGLNGANGTLLWEFTGTTSGAKEMLELPVPNETPDVIVADFWGDIFRVDGETGNQIWNTDVFGGVIQMNRLPDINGNGFDEILIASFSPTSQIFCLEGETGSVLWGMPTADYRSYGVAPLPDITGDGIFDGIAGDQIGNAYLFSGADGSIIQTFNFPYRVYTVNYIRSIDGNNSYDVLIGLGEVGAFGEGQAFCLSGGEGAPPYVYYGDADGDVQISQCDTRAVLKYLVGTGEADPAASDVTGNGDVSAYDGALILQRVAEIITCFPIDPNCSTLVTNPQTIEQSPLQEVTVTVPDTIMQADFDTLDLPIYVSDLTGEGVLSFDFSLAFDSTFVTATGVEIVGTIAEPMYIENKSEPGRIHIAAAWKDTLDGSGVLLYIRLVSGTSVGGTPLTLENFRFNEGTPMAITQNGFLQVGYLGTGEGQPDAPLRFALHQNYPNPFNPVTKISYQIARTEWVTLKVYDLLGQEIKTLVNEQKAAGNYRVQWDGTNNVGTPVASGVYIYRLKAGNFEQTRKMVLLR
ncbi:MAG: choice-of-anchor D domain-containing protein [Calditrichaeota bacterium]|nr:MAG: choice-of-anchor D domain-containing protein [Calditrichota bacterium]